MTTTTFIKTKRHERGFVITPKGVIYEFAGKSIPGIAKITGFEKIKFGSRTFPKWTINHVGHFLELKWDGYNARYIQFPTWKEAYAGLRVKELLTFEQFQKWVRATFPKEAQKMDANAETENSFEHEARWVHIPLKTYTFFYTKGAVHNFMYEDIPGVCHVVEADSQYDHTTRYRVRYNGMMFQINPKKLPFQWQAAMDKVNELARFQVFTDLEQFKTWFKGRFKNRAERMY